MAARSQQAKRKQAELQMRWHKEHKARIVLDVDFDVKASIVAQAELEKMSITSYLVSLHSKHKDSL